MIDRVDALGMPRAIVDWRVGAPELRTAEVFAGRLDALLRGARLGRLELSELPCAPTSLEATGRRRLPPHRHDADGDRHPGPAWSTATAACSECENLFIAGSAVFPTSGWSNPTLTLLALGYRLADRLKSELDGIAPQQRLARSRRR